MRFFLPQPSPFAPPPYTLLWVELKDKFGLREAPWVLPMQVCSHCVWNVCTWGVVGGAPGVSMVFLISKSGRACGRAGGGGLEGGAPRNFLLVTSRRRCRHLAGPSVPLAPRVSPDNLINAKSPRRKNWPLILFPIKRCLGAVRTQVR